MQDDCKIITVANQKGGVGKTSTTLNLGHALSAAGKRVLLVDADPQANLTRAMDIESPDSLSTTMSSILPLALEDGCLPSQEEYIVTNGEVDCIPSNKDLAAVEVNLHNDIGGNLALQRLLTPLREEYDFIIVDTNPSLGLLTVNALAACDSVIIPITPEVWSITGLNDLLTNIGRTRRLLNPTIQIEGILFTICDQRRTLYKQVSGWIAEDYDQQLRIFETIIPSAASVSRANSANMSVMAYAPNCRAAQAYQLLAKEVLGDA